MGWALQQSGAPLVEITGKRQTSLLCNGTIRSFEPLPITRSSASSMNTCELKAPMLRKREAQQHTAAQEGPWSRRSVAEMSSGFFPARVTESNRSISPCLITRGKGFPCLGRLDHLGRARGDMPCYNKPSIERLNRAQVTVRRAARVVRLIEIGKVASHMTMICPSGEISHRTPTKIIAHVSP